MNANYLPGRHSEPPNGGQRQHNHARAGIKFIDFIKSPASSSPKVTTHFTALVIFACRRGMRRGLQRPGRLKPESETPSRNGYLETHNAIYCQGETPQESGFCFFNLLVETLCDKTTTIVKVLSTPYRSGPNAGLSVESWIHEETSSIPSKAELACPNYLDRRELFAYNTWGLTLMTTKPAAEL